MLVVLQAIELAGLEGARGGRRLDSTTSTMVGVSRSTACTRAVSVAVAASRSGRGRKSPWSCVHASRGCVAHDRVALLGAAHRLHHVAEERGMQVAEEADEAASARRCISTCADRGLEVALFRLRPRLPASSIASK
jgi:hypothetical protein